MREGAERALRYVVVDRREVERARPRSAGGPGCSRERSHGSRSSPARARAAVRHRRRCGRLVGGAGEASRPEASPPGPDHRLFPFVRAPAPDRSQVEASVPSRGGWRPVRLGGRIPTRVCGRSAVPPRARRSAPGVGRESLPLVARPLGPRPGLRVDRRARDDLRPARSGRRRARRRPAGRRVLARRFAGAVWRIGGLARDRVRPSVGRHSGERHHRDRPEPDRRAARARGRGRPSPHPASPLRLAPRARRPRPAAILPRSATEQSCRA
jgi:hypothetical protein